MIPRAPAGEGESDVRKERKVIGDMLMNQLSLWATGAQSHWRLLEDGCGKCGRVVLTEE